MSRAVTIVREPSRDGRSSTLDLLSLEVTGDAPVLAELAAVLVRELSGATGRDGALIVDDVERDSAAPSLR